MNINLPDLNKSVVSIGQPSRAITLWRISLYYAKIQDLFAFLPNMLIIYKYFNA